MLPANLFVPDVFLPYPDVCAILTLKDYGDFRVGEPRNLDALARRAKLAGFLGFDEDNLIVPHQHHGNQVCDYPTENDLTDTDGLITNTPGILLGVAIADCAAVLLFDPKTSYVGALHSGWRGSKANIVGVTINKLKTAHQVSPGNLIGYISPMAQVCCYEVSENFQGNFDLKYFEKRGTKWFFNNQAQIIDQLKATGVPIDQIEIDQRCTIHDLELRSFRRDHEASGRMIAAIGLKP
ncbi:MAG: polyphenol oxidase family protein [Candidatus Saccharimonadia bacterium]